MDISSSFGYTSKIGLGSVQFGTNYGISNANGQTAADEVSHILNISKSYKINIIDTAAVYGNAEETLGENKLDEFNIVSKYMPSPIGKCSIKEQLATSLDKLKVKNVYGYLSHRPLNILDEPVEWEILNELKEAGLVSKIGFSLNEPFELESLLKKGFFPDLIQVPFNYFDNRFEQHIINLKNNGCEIHTRSTFLQGLFFTQTKLLNAYFDDIKELIKSLQDSVNYLPASLLKFVIEKPFVDKVIIGVNNSAHLKNNIETLHLAQNMPALDFNISNKFLIPSNWPKLSA